jgi:endonuclease/exonuclease/phosphatase family metal-dependent hydrolase
MNRFKGYRQIVGPSSSRKLAGSLAVPILAMVLSPVRLSGQVYVNPTGSFAPDGTFLNQFSVVKAGLCAVSPGDPIAVFPGSYHETFTSGAPAILTTLGGTATIGAMGTSTTSLKIVSYNTHLFGSETSINLGPPFPSIDLGGLWFQDPERAHRIAIRLDMENADVVGLQEVWDPALFQILASESGYASGFYGGGTQPNFWNGIPVPAALNSGLFLMSQYQLTNVVQFYYAAETGFVESLASKGYLRGTIVKDGFAIGLFDTHTQSGSETDSDIYNTRAAQLNQLANSVASYRSVNPNHLVVVMGDFNVTGEEGEYYNSMRPQMGGTGHTRDGARNERCSPEMTACTSCLSNQLRVYFNPDGTDETRLDYILYAPSLDGTADIVPITYQRRIYQTPPGLPPLSYNGLTTNDLSDHYGIFIEFRLIHL